MQRYSGRPSENLSAAHDLSSGKGFSPPRNGVAHATYNYNGLEQLVSRSTTAPGGPAGAIHYIHDFADHLIAEADGAT